MAPLLSIVIPVYNVELYLNECIDSIVNEYSDLIEIILVDDGSPDMCPTICDNWAQKLSYIYVYHKANGGLSDARNFGLNCAKGEYVWFIDSDDKLMPGAITQILDILVSGKNYDIICTPLLWAYDSNTNKVDISIEENIYTTGKSYIKARYPLWCAQRFVIRKSILDENKILFPLSLLHEDEYFGRMLLYYSENVLIIKSPIYYYRQREGSIVHTRNMRSLNDMVKICYLLDDFITSKVLIDDYPLMKSDLSDLFFGVCSKSYKLYDKEDNFIFASDNYGNIRNFFKTNFNYFSLWRKVRTIIFLISPSLSFKFTK